MRMDVGNGNFSECVNELPLVARLYDATANDSDKTFTVPAGELWKINNAHVTLVTTATVGNRQIVIEVSDAGGALMGRISAGAVQAASLTRHYSIMQGTYRESAFVNADIQIPMPADLYVKSGCTIRVYDSAAVAAAADDMAVRISYKKYTV